MSKTKWRLILPGLLSGMMVMLYGRSVSGSIGEKVTFAERMGYEISRTLGETIYGTYMPCISFVGQQERATPWILREQIDSLLPFYGYLEAELPAEDGGTNSSIREILLAEAQEGIAPAEEDNETQKEQTSDLNMTIAELLRTENEAAMEMMQSDTSVFIPHTLQREMDQETLEEPDTFQEKKVESKWMEEYKRALFISFVCFIGLMALFLIKKQ